MPLPQPPRWAVGSVLRAYGTLGRLRDTIVPPEVAIISRLLAVADARAIGVAVELGVADELGNNARTADDLAAVCGAHPDSLRRLLDLLAHQHLIRRDGGGRYRLTRVGARLRRDHPQSLAGWAEFFGGELHTRLWSEAGHSFRTGEAAPTAAAAGGFFPLVHEVEPAAGAAFDRAMGESARFVAETLVAAYDGFAVASTVCDVGGGTGRFLSVILDAHPHLRGTVFDLPATVGRLVQHPRLDGRGGSFFDEVPSGFDLYLLHVVIHDWSDHEASRILEQVRRAMDVQARVVVVESALDPGGPVLFGHQTDLEMLVLTGSGRERSTAQFEALFRSAGFAVTRAVPLASLSTAFELRPT